MLYIKDITVTPCVVCQVRLAGRFRFVVVNNDLDSPHPTYELSRIVQRVYPYDRWVVPLERNKVGSKCKPPNMSCEMYPAHLGEMGDRPNGIYGFPLHNYCWEIVQQLMGPLVDNQLRLFIQLLENRWDRKRIDNVNRFITVNPMHVPALGKLINDSKLRGERSRPVNLRKQAAKLKTDSSLSLIECSALSLPLEIKLMILDHVDPKDMENMLLATDWNIPQTYWRMRLYSGSMFEFRGLDQNMDIDWQFLCVEFEKKSQTWYALRNRNRIVGIVNDIVGPFHDALGTNSCKELQKLKQDRKKRLIKLARQAEKGRKNRRRLCREVGL